MLGLVAFSPTLLWVPCVKEIGDKDQGQRKRRQCFYRDLYKRNTRIREFAASVVRSS